MINFIVNKSRDKNNIYIKYKNRFSLATQMYCNGFLLSFLEMQFNAKAIDFFTDVFFLLCYCAPTSFYCFLVLKSRDTNVIDCKYKYRVSLPDQSSTQMYCTGYLLSSSEMECNSNNLYFLLQVFLSFHLIFFPLLTFTFYKRYCLYGTLHTRRTLLLTVHPIF